MYQNYIYQLKFFRPSDYFCIVKKHMEKGKITSRQPHHYTEMMQRIMGPQRKETGILNLFKRGCGTQQQIARQLT